MDYSPVTLYQPVPEYWGEIDNALRQAAFRGVPSRVSKVSPYAE